jgi:hypothetical protein
MTHLVSRELAGRRLFVNDALVAFDAAGVCQGIVGYVEDGRLTACDIVDELREQDVAKLLALPYVSEPDEDAGAEDEPDELAVGVALAGVEGDLHDLTKPELLERAEARGLVVNPRMSKHEIVMVLCSSVAEALRKSEE